MILVDSLLYKIDQKLNKLSSNLHQQIPLEDKILALNEGQLKLIKQKVDGINVVSGFDSIKKRYEALQNLIEDYVKHPLELTKIDEKINQYKASLVNLDPRYMFYIDSYITADKGTCKDRIIWVNRDLSRHSDLQFILNNEHFKPSFEYQETFNILTSDDVSIFTDGTFSPTKLYLMYLRYPKYIDKAGYTKFDGTASSDQNCELEEYLEDELLDITVQNIAMYTENIGAVQSAQL